MPIAISNASRLSLMSVSLTYNPALVRVRSVQDGPFFKQGGVTPSFNQQVDANAGRVDISVTRGADPTGASGTGLLAALVFDAVAPGTATFTLTGVSAQPDGRTVRGDVHSRDGDGAVGAMMGRWRAARIAGQARPATA